LQVEVEVVPGLSAMEVEVEVVPEVSFNLLLVSL
jgi:hypothetical protein